MNKIIGNYIIKQELGSGQFGAVYYAKDITTNAEFAIKIINMTKKNSFPRLISLMKNEMHVLSKIDNPNIIKLKEFIQSRNNFYFVYEYCNGGTLEDYLSKKKKLSEQEALYFFQQIINGFKSMFIHKVLHRDLKPANILLHDGFIKIADFGFCKPMENHMDLTKTMVGSPIYMAPEIMKGEEYNTKADIWSMGVVLFEMLFGFCPYEDKTIIRLLNQISSTPLTIPKNINPISKKLEELLRKFLIVDPQKRIEWSEIIKIDWNEFAEGREASPEREAAVEEGGSTSRVLKYEMNKSYERKEGVEGNYYIGNEGSYRNLNKSYAPYEGNSEKMEVKYEQNDKKLALGTFYFDENFGESKRNLRKMMKERNLIIFVLKTIENISAIEIFAFLRNNDKSYLISNFFNKCLKLYDDLIEKYQEIVKVKEDLMDDEQEISELKVLIQTIKHEKSELNKTYELFLLDLGSEIHDKNDNFLIKSIVEKISNGLKEEFINDDIINRYLLKRNLIYAVFVMDSLQCYKIISMFFVNSLKYSEQPYLKLMETYEIEELYYLFIKKKDEIIDLVEFS